jgi:hypothetical protein
VGPYPVPLLNDIRYYDVWYGLWSTTVIMQETRQNKLSLRQGKVKTATSVFGKRHLFIGKCEPFSSRTTSNSENTVADAI